MMKYLYAALLTLSLAMIHAQDTIVVQTLTWDSTTRSGVFTFPNDPDQSYRKILMRYNMRCHDGIVGNNGTTGCYEWDYSCNTFITDSTLVDSTRATHPSHLISNFSGTAFSYSNDPTYTYLQFEQHQVTYTSVISETAATVGLFNFSQDIAQGQSLGSYQYLYLADELAAAGLAPGPITGLRWDLDTDGGPLNFLTVGLKATAETSLSADVPDLGGFTPVYSLHTDFAGAGEQQLNFYQPFVWDGVSNVIVSYHFTSTPTGGPANSLKMDLTAFESGLENNTPDNALLFSGVGQVALEPAPLASIDNEITIAFWCYGTPETMPANSTIFEGRDDQNRRQANVHLPWGDSRVYWDCGNNGAGYDRIDKAANAADFEGKWNHWAFTKNAATGQMRIYLNGSLWHSGTGKTRPIDLTGFNIGSAITSTLPYYGAINDFAIFDEELDAATIAAWMYQNISPDHPNWANLVAYYPLEEGAGQTTADLSANGQVSPIYGFPAWQQLRGGQLYRNFKTVFHRPVTTFVQGEYTIDDQTLLVLDSVENAPHSVVSFAVQGTDLVAIDTQYVFPSGAMDILDESGQVVGTINAPSDGTINISSLTYYSKRPAKFELLSLVTPYGIGLNLTPEGKTFTFDVTDFGPILRGDRRLSVELGGEYQEELDIQFLFITGTPEREVQKIQNVWPFARGWYADIQNNNIFESRDLTLSAQGDQFKVRTTVTGHGQNGEFVPRTHSLNLGGGSPEFSFDVWKACGDNPIYPQGGTWTFDRAGWCPGMATDLHEFFLTDLASPGQTVQLDYTVEGPFMNEANYLVSAQLVTYGPLSFALDASLEAILRPSMRVEYERVNPACTQPAVLVRNSGSQTISSLQIEYWVAGNSGPLTHTYNGFIFPGGSAEIDLPLPAIGFWKTDLPLVFHAKIVQVNGQADQYADNNEMKSAFELPLIFADDLELYLKLRTNNRASENAYVVLNQAGEVALSRNNMANATTYTDQVLLPPGCYTFRLTDTGDDGLSYWYWDVVDPSVGSGWFKVVTVVNGFEVTLESFESEFGSTLQFDFVIGEITSVRENERARAFSVYPNPTYSEVTVEMQGFESDRCQILLTDIHGRTLRQEAVTGIAGYLRHTLSMEGLPAGTYFLRVAENDRVFTRQIIKM